MSHAGGTGKGNGDNRMKQLKMSQGAIAATLTDAQIADAQRIYAALEQVLGGSVTTQDLMKKIVEGFAAVSLYGEEE